MAQRDEIQKIKIYSSWEAIERRLEEGSVASGKLAVIEADKMLDEALGITGICRKGHRRKNRKQ